MAIREFDYKKEPIVSIVKQILTDAIKYKASDIHFNPIANGLIIKFRTDGDLVEYTKAPETVKKNLLTRVKILASMNITENSIPQYGSITFDYNDNNYNMRASTLPILDGEKIVVHLSNYKSTVSSLDTLNISENNLSKIKKLIKNNQGLILISGSQASGKTTTMYTLIKELDSEKNSIISIEDPVKMKIEGINQVQVCKDKGLTTSAILKSILSQDPNIIVLSEMNDDETTRQALRASTTGRLVISTMYAKNAYDTLFKLTNMEVEKYLLKTSLAGIISQRLVKKLCPLCKQEKETNEYEKNIFKKVLNKNINKIHIPIGCEKCIDGYQDRIPITEVIEINDEIKAELSTNTNHELLRKIIYQNNRSILEDGLNKVLNGETSFDEIIRITDIGNDFGKYNEDIKYTILGENKPIIETDETDLNNLENIQTTATQLEKIIKDIPITEEVTETNITPEEEKETDAITKKIREANQTNTNNGKNELSINQNTLNQIKQNFNYDNFEYDDSYINNF